MVLRFDPKSVSGGYNSPFKMIIDEQSMVKNEAHKKTRNSLYASDYGSCQKKVFFQFFPDAFPSSGVDARVARVFANGEAVHIRLQEYLASDVRQTFRDEVNIPRDELDVHGRCDGVSVLNGQVYVLEFKSINKDSVSEPKREHVGQLTWYLHMFEKERKKLRTEFGIMDDGVVTDEHIPHLRGNGGRLFTDLSDVERSLVMSSSPVRGELIYESKANQHTFHFPVAYNESEAKEIEFWFAQMKQFVEKKDMPVVHYAKGKFPCSWGYTTDKRSAYWELCHGEKKAQD